MYYYTYMPSCRRGRDPSSVRALSIVYAMVVVS